MLVLATEKLVVFQEGPPGSLKLTSSSLPIELLQHVC